MKLFFLYCLVLSFCLGANAGPKPNIVIYGKLVHTTVLPGVIVDRDFNVFWEADRYNCTLNKDSTFTIKLYIATPREIRIINQSVFAEPGDSVGVTITGKGYLPEMVFEGSKASNYNYFPGISELVAAYKAENKIMNLFPLTSAGLLSYKIKLDEMYRQKYLDRDLYIKKNKVSKAFYNYTYAQIRYQYLRKLLERFIAVNKAEPLDEITTAKYFDGIKLNKLQDDNYVNLNEYNQCLYEYVMNYGAMSRSVNDQSEARAFDLICGNFTKATRNILLGKLLVQWFNKGEQKDREAILSAYNKSKAYFTSKEWYDKLFPFFRKYTSSDIVLSEDTTTLITTIKGASEKLGQLIRENEGKVMYVDLWASWCGPCIKEMPNSKALAKAYQDKNIVFVYLSIDKDRLAWQKGVDKLAMSDKNSFLLVKGVDSSLAQNIALTLIPRYLIVNKAGHIVFADALRPDDEKLKKVLDDLLLE